MEEGAPLVGYSDFIPCCQLRQHDYGGGVQKVDFNKPAWEWQGEFTVMDIRCKYQGWYIWLIAASANTRGHLSSYNEDISITGKALYYTGGSLWSWWLFETKCRGWGGTIDLAYGKLRVWAQGLSWWYCHYCVLTFTCRIVILDLLSRWWALVKNLPFTGLARLLLLSPWLMQLSG